MKLLLAAFPPELGVLLQRPPVGWKVDCVGIGVILATVNTMRLIEQHRPTHVHFVGTCGAYDDRLAVGDIISASEVVVTSLEELRGHAYRPEQEKCRWTASQIGPFPSQPVVVPPAITRTYEGARLLGAIGAAEHLELAGVLAACASVEISCSASLVVANRVGPHAQAEWKTHHKEVSRRMISALEEMNFFDGE